MDPFTVLLYICAAISQKGRSNMYFGRTRIAFAATILCLQGCAAVTITPNGQPKLETPPTFIERQSFYLFGIIGENHIDVESICGTQGARQLQTIDRCSDRVFGAITLGIYSPRTAKVWCNDDGPTL